MPRRKGRACGWGATAEPPERIVVAYLDTDVWFDVYDALSDAERDVVGAIDLNAMTGVSSPLLADDPRVAGAHALFQKHPDLARIEEVTDQYVFFATSAPESYDGFSTLMIGPWSVPEQYRGLRVEKANWRLVAIMPRDVQWQTMRYASGLEAVDRVWP